jgi:hypothetical protein
LTREASPIQTCKLIITSHSISLNCSQDLMSNKLVTVHFIMVFWTWFLVSVQLSMRYRTTNLNRISQRYVSAYMRIYSLIGITLMTTNNQINSAMSSQRSNDFTSLKHPMLEYILTNRNSDTLQPPIPKSSCKSNRGTNHPRLAHELCPRKWLDKFDIDVDL